MLPLPFLAPTIHVKLIYISFLMCTLDCTLSFSIFGSYKIEQFLQPTVPAEGRSPPRVGNIGHITRISNKLVQMGSNSDIQTLLQVFT